MINNTTSICLVALLLLSLQAKTVLLIHEISDIKNPFLSITYKITSYPSFLANEQLLKEKRTTDRCDHLFTMAIKNIDLNWSSLPNHESKHTVSYPNINFPIWIQKKNPAILGRAPPISQSIYNI